MVLASSEPASAYDIRYNRCMKYFSRVYRESRAFLGDDAPYYYFMAQIELESSCREGIVAPDGGQGLAQFMPETANWIHSKERYLQELTSDPEPFNPKWAIRAMILYDKFCYEKTLCKGWYFAFRAYNGGIGNLNREIKIAGSCNVDDIERSCRRAKSFCEINISYPYEIIRRSAKYVIKY
ncbi:MAG: transglycosylase SLT domain-containing protein [Nitrososphaerota archaeon]